MPPIGERIFEKPVPPPALTPEQAEHIRRHEIELGRRIELLAPPIGGYMIYPLFESRDLTLTISGSAVYESNGNTIAAFVTRDVNNGVRLRTIIYSTDEKVDSSREDLGLTVQSGPCITVSRKAFNTGELEYTKPHAGGISSLKPGTFDQYVSAFANIRETIDLIEIANLDTYGVRNFDKLTKEELEKIRDRAEPGLASFVEQSMKTYIENSKRDAGDELAAILDAHSYWDLPLPGHPVQGTP